MTTFRKTRTALAFISRHTRSDITRIRALALGALLDTVTTGEVPDGGGTLFRDLVIATRDLAGAAWLDANADDPDIRAFTALDAAAEPPSAEALDEILSAVLWARFGPAPPPG